MILFICIIAGVLIVHSIRWLARRAAWHRRGQGLLLAWRVVDVIGPNTGPGAPLTVLCDCVVRHPIPPGLRAPIFGVPR